MLSMSSVLSSRTSPLCLARRHHRVVALKSLQLPYRALNSNKPLSLSPTSNLNHSLYAKFEPLAVSPRCLRLDATGGGSGGGNSGGSSGGNNGKGGDDGSNLPRYLTSAYALLIAAGGIMGYVKKNSKISMQTGVVLAALLVICGMGMGGTYHKMANLTALAIAGFLLMLSGSRFLKTKAIIPSGLLATMSLGMTLLYVTSF